MMIWENLYPSLEPPSQSSNLSMYGLNEYLVQNCTEYTVQPRSEYSVQNHTRYYIAEASD